MTRTFVPLAHNYKDENLKGWFASIKIDGMRCMWDGIGPRDERPPYMNPKCTRRPTGLWTRYGNVFNAPGWFTAEMPKGIMLDGELAACSLSKTKKIIKTKVPDDLAWQLVRFYAFDIIPLVAFMTTGIINNPYFEKHQIVVSDAHKWKDQIKFWRDMPFYQRLEELKKLDDTDALFKLAYWKLRDTDAAFNSFNRATTAGEEGLVVRNPDAGYFVKRTRTILRIKMQNDSVCKVLEVSHEPKSILVEWGNQIFRIGTGLKVLPKEGDIIKFRYAGLTDTGIPREARMIR